MVVVEVTCLLDVARNNSESRAQESRFFQKTALQVTRSAVRRHDSCLQRDKATAI